MKSILDNLTKGNFGGLSDLANSFGGKNLGGLGEKLSGAASSVGQAANSANFGIGGLLGAGVLGSLLGTLMSGGTAKKVAKGALMVGGTAAIGAVAWNFYQKWAQNQQPGQASRQGQIGQVQGQWQTGPAQASGQWQTSQAGGQQAVGSSHGFGDAPLALPMDDTAMLVLEAMVFAARADGHVDENERTNIQNALQAMFPDRNMMQMIEGLMNKPLDPNGLARRVRNEEEGFDLYRLSCMIVEVDHFMERSYLDALAGALRIPEARKLELEAEVLLAKQGN